MDVMQQKLTYLATPIGDEMLIHLVMESQTKQGSKLKWKLMVFSCLIKLL